MFTVLKKKKHSGTRKLLLVVGKNASFSYIEAYKSLRTNLKFIANAQGSKSFVITSAIPEESKSNMSINLAITLAQDGKKVILVDCDLRKLAIQKYLKFPRGRKGLTDIVSGEAQLEHCIARSRDINIDVLIAGTVPPNPSELLSSSRMKEVIQTLNERYDYVILDAPPISVVTDAAVVGNFVDGALLVVRSKFAPTDAVKLAKRKLEGAGVKIFGVVLTCYDSRKSNRKNGYSYTYEYNYYKE